MLVVLLTEPSCLKENEERQVKEAAHRRRIQELEEHKRHSWAGGEQVGGHPSDWTGTGGLTVTLFPGGRSFRVALQQRMGRVGSSVQTRQSCPAGGAPDRQAPPTEARSGSVVPRSGSWQGPGPAT